LNQLIALPLQIAKLRRGRRQLPARRLLVCNRQTESPNHFPCLFIFRADGGIEMPRDGSHL